MTCSTTRRWAFVALLAAMAAQALAVPTAINYQGKVSVNGTAFTGTGLFRFAIVNQAGTVQYWSNDGNMPPSTNVSVTVTQGVYNVILGETGGMVAVPGLNLQNEPLYLRVWFDDGTNGLQQLAPDQKLVSVGFAQKADLARDADTVDGAHAANFALSIHNHSGAQITSGTIGQAYINSLIARDSEIMTTVLANDGPGSTLDADALDGISSAGFALSIHNHSGAQITSGTIGQAYVDALIARDSEVMTLVLAGDGAGSTLDADTLDGLSSASFVQTTADYGRSGVAADLYEGASTLTAKYVNQAGDVMTGALETTYQGTSPALKGVGLYGPANGYLGVQGSPDFDGVASADYAGDEIGVLGLSTGVTDTDNYGVVGQANGVGVKGEYAADPANQYGLLGTSVEGVRGVGDTGVRAEGVSRGLNASSSAGIAVYASSTGGAGIYATSNGGTGIYGTTTTSGYHAGVFTAAAGTGLNSSSLLASTGNAAGVALWALQDSETSTEAAAILTNHGPGPLLKGFGGADANPEISVENDGTVRLYNASAIKTIDIDPTESGTTDGGQITLYTSAGTTAVEMDGDYNDSGNITLRNPTGVATVIINGDYSGTGDGRIVTQELQITGGSDLSEQFDIAGVPEAPEPAPGMVVAIDPDHPGRLAVCQAPCDKKVAGIISGAGGIETGMLMGQQGTDADGKTAVALSGRVHCLADASQGPIEPGDLLTSSHVPGHAMKVTDHDHAAGAVIGKAMTSLSQGRGLVLVLVTLQ